jgi:hypothetical protein
MKVFDGPGGQGDIDPLALAESKHRRRERQYRKTISLLLERLWRVDEYLRKYPISNKRSEILAIINGG